MTSWVGLGWVGGGVSILRNKDGEGKGAVVFGGGGEREGKGESKERLDLFIFYCENEESHKTGFFIIISG